MVVEYGFGGSGGSCVGCCGRIGVVLSEDEWTDIVSEPAKSMGMRMDEMVEPQQIGEESPQYGALQKL